MVIGPCWIGQTLLIVQASFLTKRGISMTMQTDQTPTHANFYSHLQLAWRIGYTD